MTLNFDAMELGSIRLPSKRKSGCQNPLDPRSVLQTVSLMQQ
jgi:hypothetical protein